MDRFHRAPEGQDTPTGRECRFCKQMDPEFNTRQTIDRMVVEKLDDTASAHITEDGYVQHRIAELRKKRVVEIGSNPLQKSA